MLINYVAWVTACLLTVVLVVWSIKTGKNKKYKVTVGDQIWKVTRGWSESLKDKKDSACFKKPDGKLVWLSNHFTITTEEE